MSEASVRDICLAYESGFGHGMGNKNHGNPYSPERAEAAAYSLGHVEGVKRASDFRSTVLPRSCAVTGSEELALAKLGDAFNAFHALAVLHPADLGEFVHHIHACQNIILARAGLRAMGGGGKQR